MRTKDKALLLAYKLRTVFSGNADAEEAANCLLELLSENESLQADAERYRWFRQAGEKQNHISRLQEEKLDAAIDEARKQS